VKNKSFVNDERSEEREEEEEKEEGWVSFKCLQNKI
jgi:hypothetical protein